MRFQTILVVFFILPKNSNSVPTFVHILKRMTSQSPISMAKSFTSHKFFFFFSIAALVFFIFLHNPQYASHIINDLRITTQTPDHPLDPLTFTELAIIQSILYEYPPFSYPNTLPMINSITLDEPDKSIVVSWGPNQRLQPRIASVIAYTPKQTHLLSIDIENRKVMYHKINPQSSGYPCLTSNEMKRASSIALSDHDFVQAIRVRNLDPSKLICGPLSSGWFGKEEEGYR